MSELKDLFYLLSYDLRQAGNELTLYMYYIHGFYSFQRIFFIEVQFYTHICIHAQQYIPIRCILAKQVSPKELSGRG